ncbi:MAG: hypothetical protein WC665_11445 [Sulfurimonas sp.]|jgi:hypothetical protein
MEETVEELDTELQDALLNMDIIAERVFNKELDSYEGFLLSEEWKNKIVAIGYKLKERGIDITTRNE